MMNAFDSRRDRARLLITALGIAFAVFPLAAGLLGALVLHVAAAPLHRRLAAHLPVRAAAVIVVVATALLIFVPAAWLLAVAIDATPDALRQLSDNPALAKIAAIRVGDLDVGTRVVDASSAIISWISGQVFNVLGGAVRATLNGAVALFGLYFLLSAPRASWSRVAAYLPFSREGADLLAHRF